MARETSNEDRVCAKRVKRSVCKCGRDGQEVLLSYLINKTLRTKKVKHFVRDFFQLHYHVFNMCLHHYIK